MKSLLISVFLVFGGLETLADENYYFVDLESTYEFPYYYKNGIKGIKIVNEINSEKYNFFEVVKENNHNLLTRRNNNELISLGRNHQRTWIDKDTSELKIDQDFLYSSADWEEILELNLRAEFIWNQMVNRFDGDTSAHKEVNAKHEFSKWQNQIKIVKEKKKNGKISRGFLGLGKDKDIEKLKVLNTKWESVSEYMSEVQTFLNTTSIYETFGISLINEYHPLFSQTLFSVFHDFQKDLYETKGEGSNTWGWWPNKTEHYWGSLSMMMIWTEGDTGSTQQILRAGTHAKYNYNLSQLKTVISSMLLLSSMPKVSCDKSSITPDQFKFSTQASMRFGHRNPSYKTLPIWAKNIFDVFDNIQSNYKEICL